ncbi:MAG: energy transducer TonB [Methylobacter sp.]|nr:MAG: energy transducer TonB [Methylobacter sp.]
MKVFFVKAAQAEPIRLPFENMAMAGNWLRPLAVAIAAALTALLHGLLFVWYLDRPVPPVVTEAAPLPMIDIALAAPNPGAPAKTLPPPEPPKPELKPPEKKQRPKAKPKPVAKPKVPSEIKKKLVKPETKPEATAQPPAPAASQPVPATPAPAAQTQSKAQTSPAVKDSPAHANADYLNNPKPDYPRMARQRHWEGRVVLRVYVTADGRCGDLSVYRSSGHDVLDEAAVDAVRQWRFVPGRHGDNPVASWVNVPIEFALE